MPLAEAMACGCPVIASDLSALKEIGGSACQYCPVGDVHAWTNAIARTLRDQAGAGDTKPGRQQALNQAARYTWAENARQTVEVYQRVLQPAAEAAVL